MKRAAYIAIFVLSGMAAFSIHKTHHVHGQNINGIPAQTMSGFTNVSVSTMSIGGATPLNYIGIISSSSVTPGSIGAGGCADTTMTFTGAQVGASVSGLIPPSTQGTNIVFAGVEPVATTNTVIIRFCNISTLATQTPVAGVYKALFAW